MRIPKKELATRAARTEAQRSRILDAAQKCFAGAGFHAATMATIAETAGISAGLAYRYFPSKDAIVLAIIERQLRVRRERIAALPDAADLVARLVEAYGELRTRLPEALDPALFLEMSAEATRVPAIATAIEASDRLTRADFQAWLERSAAQGGIGLDADAAASQSLLLQMLFDGMVVRATREPGLGPERLRGALERFMRGVSGTR